MKNAILNTRKSEGQLVDQVFSSGYKVLKAATKEKKVEHNHRTRGA